MMLQNLHQLVDLRRAVEKSSVFLGGGVMQFDILNKLFPSGCYLQLIADLNCTQGTGAHGP